MGTDDPPSPIDAGSEMSNSHVRTPACWSVDDSDLELIVRWPLSEGLPRLDVYEQAAEVRIKITELRSPRHEAMATVGIPGCASATLKTPLAGRDVVDAVTGWIVPPCSSASGRTAKTYEFEDPIYGSSSVGVAAFTASQQRVSALLIYVPDHCQLDLIVSKSARRELADGLRGAHHAPIRLQSTNADEVDVQCSADTLKLAILPNGLNLALTIHAVASQLAAALDETTLPG